MKTIQEKYNAILEGNFSKTQFLRDAKRELSQFLSPYNGYPDTVQILKNKGMLVENFSNYSNDALTEMIANLSRYQDNEKDIESIKRELEKRKKEVVSEAKKEKATNYEPTPAGLPAEAVSRGIDYELQAIGVNTGVEMPTEEQLAKVTAKVNKNLAKNMNHYLDLIAGESKKVDKHDKPVAATKKNTVDTFNGMKKASLKESVLEKAMSKGYTKEQVEAAVKNLKEKKGKDLNNDKKIDSKDYLLAKDKAIKGAMSEGESNFKEGDKVSVSMRSNLDEGRRKKSKGGKIVTENDYETGGYIESMGPLFDRACDMLAKAFGEWVNGPMTEPGMIAPAKKDVINYLDQKLTSQFLEEASDLQENGDQEAEEGAYLHKALRGGTDIQPHDDLAALISYAIDLGRKSDMHSSKIGREAAYIAKQQNLLEKVQKSTNKDKQVTEAVKGIISNILTEGVLTEAATGNLSKIADTYNDYEGMQTAVNALENIVTDVESYNSKTRGKIQKIYDSLKDIKNVDGLVVGSFLAPAIELAFRKDLAPVSQKAFTSNLTLPKTNVVKSGEVQEEELDEKETVFTPINESRKTKYTKR